jgi:site-specific DNA-methyltransferase (cytosine-N4-specific)
MKDLLRNGYKAKLRPSGHDISDKFQRDNGAAIPPNLIAIPNTESNSNYLRYCEKLGVKPHSARFPAQLPEFFIRMLTDVGDIVFDPFAGSCVTGEVCERLERNWVCSEIVDDYVKGAIGRFKGKAKVKTKKSESGFYKVYSSSSLWNGIDRDLSNRLSEDGGKKRVIRAYKPTKAEKLMKEKRVKEKHSVKAKVKA